MLLTVLYLLIWLLTLGFGVMVVLARRADHAAFNLMGVMVGIAANFLLLGFQFLGFIQVIVYIGAIMVLFLFVIMLLNLREPERLALGDLSRVQVTGLVCGVIALVLLIWRFAGSTLAPPPAEAISTPASGDPAGVYGFARELIETWIIPFEVTSLLLLAAVIGAIFIAQKRRMITIHGQAKPAAKAGAPTGEASS